MYIGLNIYIYIYILLEVDCSPMDNDQHKGLWAPTECHSQNYFPCRTVEALAADCPALHKNS